MTYTRSLSATLGYGTVVSIGPLVSATGTPTYTPIGEPTDLTLPKGTRKTIDVTNFNSPADTEEFIAGSLDWGTVTFTTNSVATDPGQIAVKAAFANGGLYLFKLQLPVDAGESEVTTGDAYVVNAIVTDLDLGDVSVDKVTQLKVTLKISGAPVFTPGS